MNILIRNHVIAWWSDGEKRIKTFDLKKFVYPILGIIALIVILGIAGKYDIRR